VVTANAARLLLVACLLAACGDDVAGGAVDGAQVFASACATCHGPQGKPSEQMLTRLGVRDLTAPEFRGRVTQALVEAQVRGGSKNKLMPAFQDALSDVQITAVAGFVASRQFPAPK
jgi:mono/diheme cytochrome c family protein